ncbi:sporulation protein YqfD [Natranaerobius trueperi]|uniref:sporulation protein YqfD n=1 Tax=Natranaerobius trueperi TaxID=759412 RepID=UPI0013033ED2|nr:sporulation protein YqfD [Natranaerobius trueperi]
MIFKKVWYYIIGYLEVTVIGTTVEKFINLTTQNNILIWDIKKYPRGLKLKISISDFHKLRHIIRKTNCRVKIVEKKGIPILKKKLRKRKVLVGGIVVAIVVLIYLSSFVWFIEIVGNERVSDEEIIETLEESGVAPGTKKSEFEAHEIENIVVNQHDEIIFVGIRVKGMKVQIEIVEKEEQPEEFEGPTNIVSDREAYITNILVFSGFPAVEPGDVVKEDDVLIYGRTVSDQVLEERIFEDEDKAIAEILDEFPQTQAQGVVKGKVHQKGYGESELVYEKRERTGEKITQYGYYFNGETNYLDLKEPSYVEYDKKKTLRKLNIDSLGWEIGLVRKEYYEVEVSQGERSNSEAKELAKEKAYEQAKKTYRDGDNTEIVDVHFEELKIEKDQLVRIRAILSVERNIGKEVKLQ